MERFLVSGPELAKVDFTMLAPARAQPISIVPPVEEAPPVPQPRLPPRRERILPLAYYLAVAAVLSAAGYPPRRIAFLSLAVGVGMAVQELQFYFHTCRRHPRQCVNVDLDQIAWWVVLSRGPLFLATGVSVAATGGVRSPLLATFLGAYLSAVAIVGERRQTRLLLAATSLGVCLLALLPRGWTGPDLDGSVYALLTAASVLGLGALLAPVHAIVQQKRDDVARTRDEMASDALARARTLEQIGSKVAHELKNPLTGVKALVQLGLRNPTEASSHERLEVVDREVTRMQEILQNYLSFTRPLQAMRPTRVGLGALVSDTLLVLSARADDARVRLFAEGEAAVEADPRRLKEALLNLVANAIEATPPGGEVAVEVRPLGEQAEITVRDTGRGMPAETLKRIGTPFFTTRDEGTGLGVVLARSVIMQHGGTLQYDSEPDKGTLVRVTLPRRVTTGARDAARAAGG